MSIGASAGTPANGSEAHAAWLEANRGAAIDDRATRAAFMDEEAELLRWIGAGMLRLPKTIDAIGERFAMSASVPSLARALVATS
jgi:hypothetical protein